MNCPLKETEIAETLLAVNIGGIHDVDSRGVLHETDLELYNTTHDLNTIVKEIESSNSNDKNIYSTFITSIKANRTYCCYDTFTVNTDGR